MKQNSRVTHEEEKRWNKNVWKMRINVNTWAHELVRGVWSLENTCIPSVELSERCSLSDPCSADYLTLYMKKGGKKATFIHLGTSSVCVWVYVRVHSKGARNTASHWLKNTQHVRAIDCCAGCNTAAPDTRAELLAVEAGHAHGRPSAH